MVGRFLHIICIEWCQNEDVENTFNGTGYPIRSLTGSKRNRDQQNSPTYCRRTSLEALLENPRARSSPRDVEECCELFIRSDVASVGQPTVKLKFAREQVKCKF